MTEYEHNLMRIENWMKFSGIQNVTEKNMFGGVHAWYDLDHEKFAFLYSEITGYAVTWYISKYVDTNEHVWLQKAVNAANWLIEQALDENLGGVLCRHDGDKWRPLICAFDNGMCLNGLCNIYKCTKEEKYLNAAEKIADNLIHKLGKTDGSYFSKLNVESNIVYDPGGKWSLISGPFLIKLSIGLLNLAEITNEKLYLESATSLCNWGLNFQDDSGRFKTSPDSNETFLHPHCYAAEGLLVAGLVLENKKFIQSAAKAVAWIAETQLDNGSFPAYYDIKGFSSTSSPDMTAQVLRLWCMLPESSKPEMDPLKALDSIFRLQCESDNVKADGGICAGDAWFSETNNALNAKPIHVNSWVSMFAAQATSIFLYRDLDPFHLV